MTVGPAGRKRVVAEPPASLLRCRRCAGTRFDARFDGDITLFRCASCGSHWHVELGWVTEVPPPSGAGRPGGAGPGRDA